MTFIDWVVLCIYIFSIIFMSAWIGRRQKSQEDYYLGGRAMGSRQVAMSIMATQVSAISLVGAPAFIALKSDGGLIWLQYEFAIPLAMMFIMLIMAPLYHRTHAITIYGYLEKRFGRSTRMSISAVFLVSRGLGSGVALLATAIVTSVCLQWPLWQTILLIGIVSIIYTTFGGIVADIYSDIIQLIILWSGSLVAIIILVHMLDTSAFALLKNDPRRLRIFDFSALGLGDNRTFGFWPMLVGGFFLYLSYYGCDQSQVQRLLTTATPKEAQKALMINGIFRFLLVLTYCTLGVLLIPFLLTHPEFAARLQDKQADFLVPYFLMAYFPKGILGILTRRASQTDAISGLAAGVGFNIFLWQTCGSTVSWLWWNVFGFLISFGVGYGFSLIFISNGPQEGLTLDRRELLLGYLSGKKYYRLLAIVFFLILIISFLLQECLIAVWPFQRKHTIYVASPKPIMKQFEKRPLDLKGEGIFAQHSQL